MWPADRLADWLAGFALAVSSACFAVSTNIARFIALAAAFNVLHPSEEQTCSCCCCCWSWIRIRWFQFYIVSNNEQRGSATSTDGFTISAQPHRHQCAPESKHHINYWWRRQLFSQSSPSRVHNPHAWMRVGWCVLV